MITFEKLQEKDIFQAKEVLKKGWIDTYTVYTPEQIEKITGVWHSPEQLQKESESADYFFVVAKDADRVVGVITTKKEENVIKVLRLYVLKQYQHKGIGKTLLQKGMEAFAESIRCELGVEEDNNYAKDFYSRQGFVNTGRVYKETVEGVVVTLTIFEKNLANTKKEA